MSKQVHLSTEISQEKLLWLEHTRQKHHLDSLEDTLAFVVRQYSVLVSVREDQTVQRQLVEDALALFQKQTADTAGNDAPSPSSAVTLVETLLEALFAYAEDTTHNPVTQAQPSDDSLKDAYKQALEAWDGSADAEVWDSVAADGLATEHW